MKGKKPIAVGGALALILVVAVTFAWVRGASAVLHGQPDGNGHPYVGMVDNGEFVCTGAAISPTLFITAAHCFGFSGEAVEVTFAPDGFSAQPSPNFQFGHWFPDPQFCIACAHGLPHFDTHDLAVVVLDSPVSLSRYASLPSQGLIDTLPMGKEVSLVGYGVQDRLKKLQPGHVFTRHIAPANLIQSENSISDEFIKLSANPSQGTGGTCFGDSGGPDLLGDTILAVNSFVTNGNCSGVTYSYRADTAAALGYINQFVNP